MGWPDGVHVRRCVLRRRRVAAPDVTARRAPAQVEPPPADLLTLFAPGSARSRRRVDQLAGHCVDPLNSRTPGTRAPIARLRILRRPPRRRASSSRSGRRRPRTSRGGSSRTEAVVRPRASHRSSRSSSVSDRSVSTKPWSSSAAQPDSQSDAGSAPMNENSPPQATVVFPSGSASTTRSSTSPPSSSATVVLGLTSMRGCSTMRSTR